MKTKISVVITILNEEKAISRLLDSLVNQTTKADEVVVIDGGSNDNTVKVVKKYQKRFRAIKLIEKRCSRAQGRNLGVRSAKGKVIAMTDAGCVADKNWLKRITEPFFHFGGVKAHHQGVTGSNTSNSTGVQARFTPGVKVGVKVDVVAGFYSMVPTNEAKIDLQRAMSVFLGVLPHSFDKNFLPSTRSIAFTNAIWKKVGGFPEDLSGAAEDTVFSYKLIKAGAKFARVKNAIVEWGTPQTIYEFGIKNYEYARGDAKSGIWFFPGKGLMSHNIHSLLVLLRYVLGAMLLVFGFFISVIHVLLVVLVLLYSYWSFTKVYLEFKKVKVAIWGPILQIVSDFGVMGGFLTGVVYN